MAEMVLIVGKSGSGKSFSGINLDPKTTFWINCINTKSLPFPGWRAEYKRVTPENMDGNLAYPKDNDAVLRALTHAEKNKEVREIIIDDSQELMSDVYVNTSDQNGYGKFITIGKNFKKLLNKVGDMRDDIIVYAIMHVEIDQLGCLKAKTVGKMVDQYMEPETRVNNVLYSIVSESGRHAFQTINLGKDTCKTSYKLFPQEYIPNDLYYVSDCIRTYAVSTESINREANRKAIDNQLKELRGKE